MKTTRYLGKTHIGPLRGGGCNTHEPLRIKNFFSMIEKKIVRKGSEPQISRGGSTTKKNFFICVFLREHVKKLAVLLRGGGADPPPRR